MKRIIIKIIFYNVLFGIAAILSTELCENSGNTLVYMIGASLIPLSLGFILFDIGRSIKNKQTQKKYIIYTSILVGEILLLLLFSEILGVSTVNTWLADIGTSIMLVTVIVMLVITAQNVAKTRIDFAFYLYMLVFILFISLFFLNIMAFTDWLN
ncbi:MAG: hypothetical protein FWE85_06450 [Clostridiales bacterium]|nr:hypothetical protein [Clostridiales bacterium]